MKRVLFFAMCIVAGISLATAQVTIKFNPNKGEKYAYVMEMTQDINQDMMGQSMTIKNTINMVYDMVVTEKTDDEITSLLTFKDMSMSAENPFMAMKYDSKNPPSNVSGMDATLKKIIDSILGSELKLVMGTDGTVKSATGMEAVINKMVSAFEGDTQGQQMLEMMKGQFSDEAMKQQIEQSFKVYPPAGKKVGESWDVVQNINNAGMTINNNIKYTLKSADGKDALVDFTGTIDGMNGQLKGDISGNIKFDQKTGMNESSSVQTIKGTVSANGMDIPMDITTKSKISMTVVK